MQIPNGALLFIINNKKNNTNTNNAIFNVVQ